MKNPKILLAIFLINAGCATTPSQFANQVHEAVPQTVEGCERLKPVFGYSWMAGLLTYNAGLQNAKTEALEKAAREGGTHVILETDSSWWSGHVTLADVYKCPKVATAK